MSFIKMHGLGNDFVIIDCRAEQFEFTPEQVRAICDRHKGVGCDQFVLIKKSDKADCKVEFYNADGSKSGACGNATRCVAHFINDRPSGNSNALSGARSLPPPGGGNVPNISIETAAGVLTCTHAGGMNYTINMGKARWGWKDIPLAREVDTLEVEVFCIGAAYGRSGVVPTTLGSCKPNELHEHVALGSTPDLPLVATAISMGNPHAVLFVDDVQTAPVQTLGPILENHEIFPQRANIGFTQIISRTEINLRVWERGAGETLACGTGACAAVVAGIRRNLLDNKVLVHLPGGDLNIEVLDTYEVMMTGPVAVVFEGVMKF